MSLLLLFHPAAGAAVPSGTQPTIEVDVAWGSQPLDISQSYQDMSTRVREVATSRGRNYEFDRMESGAASALFDNTDSALNPNNTLSAYYPNVKATRRLRILGHWDQDYAIWAGYTLGQPQSYPLLGYDATVKQDAVDGFLALNAIKFRPSSTTLGAAITTTPVAGTAETITVAATALPMPQDVPFIITVDSEEIQVTAILGSTTYTGTRGYGSTTPAVHSNGQTVSTSSYSFGQEYSGTRIQNALTYAGFTSADWSLDSGVALIAPSGELAGTTVLEHILLIAEAEGGRFFCARDGVFTFLDRTAIFTTEGTSRGTFGDRGGSDIPYSLSGPVMNDESLIANVVRITPDSGNVQESTDQTSIDDHLERTLEKSWPLALDNEAKAGSEYLLSRLKETKLRVPAMRIEPGGDPATLWPLALGMEIGQRWSFYLAPKGGGDAISTDVIIDGIKHSIKPGHHSLDLDVTPADSAVYWQLGVAGYSELGVTTYLAY